MHCIFPFSFQNQCDAYFFFFFFATAFFTGFFAAFFFAAILNLTSFKLSLK